MSYVLTSSHLPGIFPCCVVHTLHKDSSTVLRTLSLIFIPVDKHLSVIFTDKYNQYGFAHNLEKRHPWSKQIDFDEHQAMKLINVFHKL